MGLGGTRQHLLVVQGHLCGAKLLIWSILLYVLKCFTFSAKPSMLGFAGSFCEVEFLGSSFT